MEENLNQLEKKYCSKVANFDVEKMMARVIIKKARLEKPQKDDDLKKVHETHKRILSKEQEIKEIQVI